MTTIVKLDLNENATLYCHSSRAWSCPRPGVPPCIISNNNLILTVVSVHSKGALLVRDSVWSQYSNSNLMMDLRVIFNLFLVLQDIQRVFSYTFHFTLTFIAQFILHLDTLSSLLFFCSFKIPPWCFKDDQVSVSVGTCFHDSFKGQLELCHWCHLKKQNTHRHDTYRFKIPQNNNCHLFDPHTMTHLTPGIDSNNEPKNVFHSLFPIYW